MNPEDYRVGWICALPLEKAAAVCLLDEQHGPVKQAMYDDNSYTLGRVGIHNVAVVCLPQMGLIPANRVVMQLRLTFQSIRFILLVGIGGGVPSLQHDIRLGDVVVSWPGRIHGGVIQYDFGKSQQQAPFERTGSLNRPSDVLLGAVASLQARHQFEDSAIPAILAKSALGNPRRLQAWTYPGAGQDQLFESAYLHQEANADSCINCDPKKLIPRPLRTGIGPVIHYGLIASGNQVVRDALMRERLREELDVLCFEMEAAGLMNDFPSLVIRGICDYADSHKSKKWQVYAATVAAAYAKELLSMVPPLLPFKNHQAERMHNVEIGHNFDAFRFQPVPNEPAMEVDLTPTSKEMHTQKAELACLRSLWFKQMDSRRDNIGRAVEGTCTWINDHPKYRQWTEASHGLLWITGKPGAGKSVVLNTLVSNVERHASDQLIVASFFLHGRGSDMEKSSIGLYRSLLHQILTKARPLLIELTKTFAWRQSSQGEYGKDWTWSEKDLLDFLDFHVKEYALACPIKIFVDALDESGEETARKLSEELYRLSTKSCETGSAMSVCLTCRHYPIMDLFGGLEICVEEQNKGDIAKVVRRKLAGAFVDVQLRETLADDIIGKAAGVFLWTTLVLPKITHLSRSGYRFATIREAVQNSSPELGQLYEEILVKIPPSERALHLFQWVCVCQTALSPAQLRYALSFDEKNPPKSLSEWKMSETYIESQEQFAKHVRALSGGLVEIAGLRDQVVQCIHQSVKDYFLHQGLHDLGVLVGEGNATLGIEAAIAQAHEQIYKCCLRYLLTTDVLGQPDIIKGMTVRDRNDTYPLLRYASRRWPSHLKKADCAGNLRTKLLEYLGWPAHRLLIHCMSLCSWYHYHNVPPVCRDPDILHFAAYFDLCTLIDAVRSLDDFKSMDIKDQQGCTPLIWAVKSGNEAAAKLLLKYGASVDLCDSVQRSPLLWAMSLRYHGLIRILADLGANPCLRDTLHRTPILLAIHNRSPDTIECLLSKVASASFQDRTVVVVQCLWRCEFGIALRIAKSGIDFQHSAHMLGGSLVLYCMSVGAWEVAEYLLLQQHDSFNPDILGFGGITLLTAAARIGRIKMIRSIFERGAKVDVSDLEGRTPLSYAASSGHLDATGLFIKKGAHVNQKDRQGRTPLIWASENGYPTIVDLLLENGADAGLQDAQGLTALIWAAKGGNELVVRSLLTKHTNVEQRDSAGQTALWWAMLSRNLSAVKVLLKKVTDPNAARGGNELVARSLLTKHTNIEQRDSVGQTALWWAMLSRNLSAAKVLLENGADPNAANLVGQRLLLWATCSDYVAEVELLLLNGANVQVMDSNQQTPLELALARGNADVVKLLINHRAAHTVRDPDGLSLLFKLVKKGLRDVIEVLLQQQAEVDCQLDNGQTPLVLATLEGNVDVANLLLTHGANADHSGYEGRTPLSLACQFVNEAMVELLLPYSNDCNSQDPSGRTPLWWAATCGNTTIVKLLLENGADPNISSDLDSLPVLRAVRNGKVEITRLLLQGNRSSPLNCDTSMALLSTATDNGDSEMVLSLLDMGVDGNVVLPSGYTVASWAAKGAHFDVVKAMAGLGVDFESKEDLHGRTALEWAYVYGHENVVQFLLDRLT